MENENKSIFRAHTLNRVSTPEELDKYLVVTRPGVWFSLIAIIVLLIGVFSWAVLGRIETVAEYNVFAMEKGAVCYVPTEDAEKVLEAGKIIVGGKEYAVVDSGMTDFIVTESDLSSLTVGKLYPGQTVKRLEIKADDLIAMNFYKGEVTLEAIKPISFILN